MISAGESLTYTLSFWVQPSALSQLTVTANFNSDTAEKTLSIPWAQIQPVVFVHGILGSMPPENRLITDSGLMTQVLDPFLESYTPLIQQFQKMGYEWNRSLFVVTYDWRNSNNVSANYLAQQLDEAIIPRSQSADVPYVSDAKKADLVVHSMGGLVSRAYIQNEALYQDDVRKIVFIASPHKGFPFDYQTWEGMTWSAYLGDAPGNAGGFILPTLMDEVVWPTLVMKHNAPSAEFSPVCVPGRRPICPPELIASLAHDPVSGTLSLKEMLPLITPDDTNPPYQPPAYLIDAENRPFPHMFQQNFFLEMLNENINELVTALGADNIYVLYGNGAPETDLGYKVSQLRGTNLWRHGIPIAEVENSEGNGDDLIPWESTTLRASGLLGTILPEANEVEMNASEDAEPMRATHKEIMYHPDTIERWVPAFLGVIDHDNADARLPFATPYQLPGWAFVPNGTVDLISVVSACPVNLLITDPQGRRLGFDPATGQVLREIPHSIYTIPGSEPQIVVMANPQSGTYQVTAGGYADGEFALRADYIANNGAFLLDGFAGTTTAGQIDTYTFVYDPTIPAPPQVDAGINTTGVVNQSVTFSGSFTDINPGDTHTIDWAFGDGATATGTLTPTHTYSSAGVYIATLTVDDNTGFVISDTLQVQIIDPAAGNADLTAQYRVGESGDTSASNSDIKPFLNLVNSGTTDISLSELTVRYWYTIDTDQSQSYACDWAVLDCANITHQFVPLTNPRNGADHYLELGFTSSAGTLPGGGSSGDIQSRITKTDFSNYDETDDYSFDPMKTSYTDWTHVTLYRNGVLIWGTEPNYPRSLYSTIRCGRMV